MNKKIIIAILFLVTCLLNGYTQESNRLIIKGIVIDANTASPLPLANIGVIGTTLGVASDMDGEFELSLPQQHGDKTLRFSVMGYARYDVKVIDAANMGEMKVELKPISIRMNEVTVRAKSLVLIRMLRNVVENISKNYINRPYNYTGYFEYKTFTDDVQNMTKEAIVNIYDSKGYKRADVEDAFKSLNYVFTEVKRGGKSRSVYDNLTYFDDILTADVVRNTRNVLDTANVDLFTLIDKGKTEYEGDSVQIIAYEATNPTISLSGSAEATKFSGIIYVNLKDFAVLKNEMTISSSGFTTLGRDFFSAADANKENVKYVVSTTYKKLNSTYFLSGVNVSYSYNENSKKQSGKMQYTTTLINQDNPKSIIGRMYYEDVRSNPKFWDSYTVTAP
ncbi:MAG: carboxypeptidase-like regulatory domain-containing protein [Culturomica sp.]|jgi:hypothetical protein|nr:carboxypeptidase-like regulatory domain-containing protein [Culturomica sp.]